MNKNYGEGQLYDMRRPISIDITTRPRPFNDIPAEHNLAFFIEEASKLRLGKHRIDITAGLRSASLLNLDNRYVLDGKIYLDPRVNAKWALPRIGERKPLSIIGRSRLAHQNARHFETLSRPFLLRPYTAQFLFERKSGRKPHERPHIYRRPDQLQPESRPKHEMGSACRFFDRRPPVIGNLLPGKNDFGIPAGKITPGGDNDTVPRGWTHRR